MGASLVAGGTTAMPWRRIEAHQPIVGRPAAVAACYAAMLDWPGVLGEGVVVSVPGWR
jgi:hypothetical protein